MTPEHFHHLLAVGSAGGCGTDYLGSFADAGPVLRKKYLLSELRPLFMLLSFPVCIRGADQQGRRCLQLANRKEFCDLRFLALESLLGVLEFLDLGWNVGGLYCNEPPTL